MTNDEIIDSNSLYLSGKMACEFSYEFNYLENIFYKSYIDVTRTSGYVDQIPVVVSGDMVNVAKEWTGKDVLLSGEFRSYEQEVDGKIKHKLFAYAKSLETIYPFTDDENELHMTGWLCKKSAPRFTPLGRKVTDIVIAVNRSDGQADYIQCLCWGKGADISEKIEIGTHLELSGRVQSRVYGDNKVAYEVSVKHMSELRKY